MMMKKSKIFTYNICTYVKHSILHPSLNPEAHFLDSREQHTVILLDNGRKNEDALKTNKPLKQVTNIRANARKQMLRGSQRHVSRVGSDLWQRCVQCFYEIKSA